MNRVNFIKALAEELAYQVRPSELHQIIQYYDEIIEDLMEEGFSEEQAVAKLGSPRKLALEATGEKEIEVNLPMKFSPLVIILLIIGFPLWGSLLFAALMLVLSFYIVLWCVPFITAIFGFAGTFAGFLSALSSPLVMIGSLGVGMIQLGTGVLFFGLGLLSLVATYLMSGFFLRVTRKTFIVLKNILFKRTTKVVRV
ncbi:DUF1700 domain-containing protein [Enterococcus sp. HY326]|uniref:DUF1700 domain-containing protein n=1 Tax=Enterococcus sp. HY326 TaxID=2971265 RepID=UPI0022403191|nr:DUF1700 domain-containing protein [Enterococcus sp. HY326]